MCEGMWSRCPLAGTISLSESAATRPRSGFSLGSTAWQELVFRFNTQRLSILPETTRGHLRNANREFLLALRSVIDGTINRMERGQEERSARGRRRQRVTVEEERPRRGRGRRRAQAEEQAPE